jgi:DNA-binding MarR family transcriptional regulator
LLYFVYSLFFRVLKQLLTDIGFTQKEADLYLALLHFGAQPASAIARTIGANRITAYQILQELAKKGVVSTQKRINVTFFAAEPPERLISYVEKKRGCIESSLHNLCDHILEFQTLVNPAVSAPKVKTFGGLSGIRAVYEDTLSSRGCVFSIQDLANISEGLRTFVFSKYIPKRLCSGMECKLVLPDNKANRVFSELHGKQLRQVRYVSPKAIPFQAAVILYDDKTAIISDRSSESFGVIIESDAFYRTMLGIFNVVWRQGVRV